MHLIDSLGRNKELDYICCLHEQTASIAAGAYAQYNNNIGIALVTTGPGGTNAITGVAAAWADSIPLLIISGQVKTSDMSGKSGIRMLGFQEIDIVSVVKPITKYAVAVTNPLEIKYHLEKAFYIAKNGRPGPVWIDIPLDIQASMIEETQLKSFDLIELSADNSDNQISNVINLLNRSHRPVILAGYGIKLANSKNNFLDLIEKLKFPVLTTWKAIDILPENHDLFFGRPGSVGQRGANFIQQNADMIISIGARLDFGQIGYSHENFAREAKKIIVDIDQAELSKFKFKIDIPICSDAGYFINELLKKILSVERKDRSEWLSKCKNWVNKYPVITKEHWNQTEFVSTYALVDVLSEEMAEFDIFVPGSSGACSDIPLQAFRIKAGQRVLNSPSLGAMGFGLPSTIGACLASNKRKTICTNGDGGFQLNIQDLETIARLKLPIKFFILNNDGYGSIKTTQKNYFNGNLVASDPSSGLTLPGIIRVANAYGVTTFKISKNHELKETVKKVLLTDGPVICEVMINPNEQVAPKVSSLVKKDGSMVSKPLEDLLPFLDREEFKNNMIIPVLEETK